MLWSCLRHFVCNDFLACVLFEPQSNLKDRVAERIRTMLTHMNIALAVVAEVRAADPNRFGLDDKVCRRGLQEDPAHAKIEGSERHAERSSQRAAS